MNLDILKAIDLPGFLDRRYGVRVNGGGMALCPFHDDGVPSFSVSRKNGVWLFNCHACGAKGTILDFVMKKDNLGLGDTIRRICELEGIRDESEPEAKPKPKIVRTHLYKDEDGVEIWQKVKLSDGTFRCRRKGPDGRWICNLDGVRRVPYRLDKIKGEPAVIVCEGERDADTLADLGYPATSGPSGKDSWPDEITPIFSGKEIRVMYDVGQDEAARAVAKKLSAVCPHVAILKVPLPNSEDDITDYLAQFEGEDAKRDAFLGILAVEERFAPDPEKPAVQVIPFLSFPELRKMEILVEWSVEGLLPENSVTVLYGRTSVGKSWLALMVAEAVSSGLPIFGKPTKMRPVVYIDMENPLANMKERADALEMRSMNAQIWHSTMSPRPPKLDGRDWELYKAMLPPNALVIFDTSRTAHDGKENDSDVAALVMNRCRELRDMGLTILILHHTPKANDRDIKASGAWADLADHTIQFYKVKGQGLGEDEAGEILPGSLLCLATGKKTRYSPVKPIYMTLTNHGLELAEDPDSAPMGALSDHIAGEGAGKNQTAIIDWAVAEKLGPGTTKGIRTLLDRGEKAGLWHTEPGLNRSKLYYSGRDPR